MKTLIIYDDTGYILMKQTGNYRVPEGGIQYLECEIPDDKLVVEIDVKNKKPVLEDLPKSETDILKDEIEALKNDIADLTLQMIMEE